MIGYVIDGAGAGGYGAVISSYEFVENLFIRLKSTPHTHSFDMLTYTVITYLCVCRMNVERMALGYIFPGEVNVAND